MQEKIKTFGTYKLMVMYSKLQFDRPMSSELAMPITKNIFYKIKLINCYLVSLNQ